jgi:hypothetical protein
VLMSTRLLQLREVLGCDLGGQLEAAFEAGKYFGFNYAVDCGLAEKFFFGVDAVIFK